MREKTNLIFQTLTSFKYTKKNRPEISYVQKNRGGIEKIVSNITFEVCVTDSFRENVPVAYEVSSNSA